MASDPNPFSNPNPVNPYAPTQTAAGLGAAGFGGHGATEAEAIRNAHLSHEASIKSIGFLYLLGGTLGFFATAMYLVLGITSIANPGGIQNGDLGGVVLLALAVFMGALSTLQFLVGRGLRKLVPWSRIAGIIFSAIGLLGFPLGTLISAYILYLLVSQKGVYIFSPGYARVIADTPHIRYKTSIVVWIFLGLLVALIAFGIIAAVASSL